MPRLTRHIAMTGKGGPEVLALCETDLPEPGRGEVRIRQTAIGVNFVDTYHRTGLYPLPPGAVTPGVEAAGIIEAVGPDTDGFRPGARVAYAGLPVGAYAEARVIASDRLVPLPDAIDERTAAAMMLKGLTAHMLLTRVYPVRRGDTVLVHAAAGGLGLVLVQWARRLGATVLGTVGTREKADLALRHGLDEAILYREVDFAAEARRLTGGRGVDYAIDGIGGHTLLRTFDAVRPFGTVASIGQAEGTIPPLDAFDIGPRRSLALARPSVLAHASDPAAYRAASAEVLRVVEDGLAVTIGASFPLEDAAEAHRLLEAGRTTGSVILEP